MKRAFIIAVAVLPLTLITASPVVRADIVCSSSVLNACGGGGGGIGGAGTFTATRVPFASSATTLTDDADMTFATDTLKATKFCAGAALDAANSMCFQSNSLITEGATADASEFTLAFGDVAADGTLTVNQHATLGTTLLTSALNIIGNAGGAPPFAAFPFSIGTAGTTSTSVWTSSTTARAEWYATGAGGNDFVVIRAYSASAAGNNFGVAAADQAIVYCDDATNCIFGNADNAPLLLATNSAVQARIEANGELVPGPATSNSKVKGGTKALTESNATSVARISVAQGAGTGGRVHYTVLASDAAPEIQTRGGGSFTFSVNNIGGTETCTMNNAAPDETNDANAATVSSGTLTYDWTCATAAADTVDLALNAVSSLTQTTLRVDWWVELYGPGSITPQ
jgi:hypothetical protein